MRKTWQKGIDMTSKTENRRSPRVQIKWPVVIKAPNHLAHGKIENLSLGGAHIRLRKDANLNNSLPMVITADGRLISVSAQVVWSNVHGRGDKAKFCGVGVRFTKMMISDRQYLQMVISEHL